MKPVAILGLGGSALAALALSLASCARHAPGSEAAAPVTGTCANGPVPMKTPLVKNIFTADPSGHVFDGKLFIYPSHDLTTNPPPDDDGAEYGMKDYHVLSIDTMSCDAVVDHGEVLNIANVPWARKEMWAPDAAHKNGTYYLYFPAQDESGVFRIGVATSASPAGPFTARPEPIANAYSIDPAVFVDDDGTAYLYLGGLHGGQLQDWQTGTFVPHAAFPPAASPAISPRMAKLGADMTSLADPLKEVSIVDEKGEKLTAGDSARRFFEGIWIHKYKGTYYMSYSTGDTHFLVYATSTSPSGPFTYRGHILEPVRGWTTHHSIVEFENKWWLLYHDDSLSGKDDERCVKLAELTHNPDGTIADMTP